jgi:poly(A) polymerase
MTTLPAAAWTQRADLAALVAALDPDAQGLCRWVGGAVRDTLMGLPVKDIDMATCLVPDDVVARLARAGIRAIPTGIAHGTVTALCAQGPVEVTTLRRDVSTDGRHATVAFSDDWREDAARRDFTINALYADPLTLAISDFFGGQDDLIARRVRFIGDAHLRIREDYLRILRYFRFHARFGSTQADPAADTACEELAAGLKGLSRERIASELLQILALPDPAPTLTHMARLGVLPQILPEADPAPLPALIAIEAQCGATPEPLRRLAAILPADPATADTIAARLRLGNAQRKHLALLAGRTPADPASPRALAYRIGLTAARDRLLLNHAPTTPLDAWTVPTFPLKGGTIVERGLATGPDVARLLRAVEARWIAEDFPNPTRVETLLNEATNPPRPGEGDHA